MTATNSSFTSRRRGRLRSTVLPLASRIRTSPTSDAGAARPGACAAAATPGSFPTRRSSDATAMDPFTGLGSTAVACARLGVNFIGAELDEIYLEEAVARIGEVTAARSL